MRALPLLLAALLALPIAAAHGSTTDSSQAYFNEQKQNQGSDSALNSNPQPLDTAPPVAGYTGPGRQPYISYFEGVWLYGQESASPLGNQSPRHMRASGDWVVWEDATRSDIFLYSVSAGSGFYITKDSYIQRNPDISGNYVVWEDYRAGNRADVWAYEINSTHTFRVSNGTNAHHNPSLDGDIVAWEDDRSSGADIYAERLSTREAFPVATTPDRETDALVVGHMIYYRDYRFNVWDVQAYDIEKNVTIPITSDPQLQSAPFSNGQDALFFSQSLGASWDLLRYNATRDQVTATPLKTTDTTPVSAQAERVLATTRDVASYELVARNLTSGVANVISGRLTLTTEPVLSGRNAFAAVRTHAGTSLLALDVSPFAFTRAPTLSINNPPAKTIWTRPIVAQGILKSDGWTDPITFTYRVDDNPPQVIPPGASWRATLDNQGLAAGKHTITFRATYREGPPIESTLVLVVPAAAQQVDVANAGVAFHAARVYAYAHHYLLDNPLSWVLVPVIVVLLILGLARIWFMVRPRRKVAIAEYVSPDDAA